MTTIVIADAFEDFREAEQSADILLVRRQNLSLFVYKNRLGAAGGEIADIVDAFKSGRVEPNKEEKE